MANNLAVRYTAGSVATGEVAVYVNNGGELTQLGNSWGASTVEVQSSHIFGYVTNLAVQFGDADELYAWVQNDIRKYNTGTQDWDVVYSVTNMTATAAGDRIHSGLVVINVSGTPTIVGMFKGAGNGVIYALTSTDGSTWTEITSGTTSNNGDRSLRILTVYGTSLVCNVGGTAATVVMFDASSNSFTFPGGIYSNNGNVAAASSVVYDNRLFVAVVANNSADESARLYEFSGGVFIEVIADLIATMATFAGGGISQWHELFHDSDGNLIYLAFQSGPANSPTDDDGLRAFHLDVDDYTITEITNTVVPATLRYPIDWTITEAELVNLRIFANTDNSVQNTPITEVYIAIATGASNIAAGTYQRFIWNGISSLMSPSTVGPSIQVALSRRKDGGGDHVYNAFSNEMNIYESAARAAVTGGLQLTFRASERNFFTDLEAYYKFNDNGVDSSGNSRNLTFTGTEAYATGKFGNGYSLPGNQANFANRGTNDAILGLTGSYYAISFWASFDTLSTDNTVVEKYTTTGPEGWSLAVQSTGGVVFVHDGGVVLVTSTGVVTTGSFHHIAVVSNGSTIKIYVNGVEEASTSFTANAAHTNPLRIGDSIASNTPLDGVVDEIAIWSSDLSIDEVIDLYNAGSGQELEALADKTVKLLYASDGQIARTQATLVGTATGGSATRVGNEIQNVTADNSTDYTLVWDAAADGFSSGDPYIINLTVE
jgi:hypothetical protein